jgi:hypothetical protein
MADDWGWAKDFAAIYLNTPWYIADKLLLEPNADAIKKRTGVDVKGTGRTESGWNPWQGTFALGEVISGLIKNSQGIPLTGSDADLAQKAENSPRPPPRLDEKTDAIVQQARQRAALEARSGGGYASTFLTGPQGVTGKPKTLLGGGL